MRTINLKIDRDLYKRLKKLTYVNFYDTLQKEEIIPVQHYCGYGVYNVQLKENNGEYAIVYDIGDTCD